MEKLRLFIMQNSTGKYVIIMLFTIGLWLSFSVASQANKPVEIVTTEIPPYTGNEKDTTGFLTEIVKSAFVAGGMDARVKNVPWARGKLYILNGKTDAIFPGSYDEMEELNTANVLIYKTSPIVLLKRKGRSIAWNGHVTSLKGYLIGVMKGFSYTKEFDHASYFNKESVPSNEQNVRKLSNDRIDLAIMDELTARFYMKKIGFEEKIELLSPPVINSTEFYLGFSQSQRSREQEQEAFRQGLARIRDDGTYDKILKKYNVDSDVRLRTQEVKIVKFADEGTSMKPTGSEILSKVKKTNPNTMVIGFCGFHWQTDGYQRTYEHVLLQEAQRLGVTIINHDAKASLDVQIEQVEDLIHRQVDVIAVWPVHGKKILPVLEKAKAAGIPVLIVNTPVDVSGFNLIRAYTGPNNVQEGRLAAQMMIEALSGKGTVVEIHGFPGYSTAIERSIGFSEELEKQKMLHPEIDIEIIDVIAGYWSREKAKQAAERLIRRHPHFDGLYVGDDNMGVGAIEALEAAGRLQGVHITSATLFGDGYDAIKAGKIYGSVWQSPTEDAKLALKTAIQIIKQEEITFFNFFETPKITRENIHQLERPPF